MFSKHKNKAKFKTLDDFELISGDFIKELSDPDGWIIPRDKMTNADPFLLNGSSKIQFFTDI